MTAIAAIIRVIVIKLGNTRPTYRPGRQIQGVLAAEKTNYDVFIPNDTSTAMPSHDNTTDIQY